MTKRDKRDALAGRIWGALLSDRRLRTLGALWLGGKSHSRAKVLPPKSVQVPPFRPRQPRAGPAQCAQVCSAVHRIPARRFRLMVPQPSVDDF